MYDLFIEMHNKKTRKKMAKEKPHKLFKKFNKSNCYLPKNERTRKR